jgi:(2Fe-2S) ferredoxin
MDLDRFSANERSRRRFLVIFVKKFKTSLYKKNSKMKYTKHVFVCTNYKEAPKKCCGSERGMELVNAFKEGLKERGLDIEIRAQRAGCLDTCGKGPSVVVYPEGVFYGFVTPDDVNEIIEKHLVGNEPVERLVIA